MQTMIAHPTRRWQLLKPGLVPGVPTVPCPKCGGGTHLLFYHCPDPLAVVIVASCDKSQCDGWKVVGEDS